MDDFTLTLKNIFQSRQDRNSRYSIRAFARDLGVPVSCVSEIFNGKRKITVRLVEKLAQANILSLDERQSILDTGKILFKNQKTGLIIPKRKEVSVSDFEKVFTLKHLIVAEAFKINKLNNDLVLIADYLQLELVEVIEIAKSLAEVGLIKIWKGHYLPSEMATTTSNHISSDAIKKHHLQSLDLAKKALVEVPLEKREYVSLTMALSEKDIAKAKESIFNFMDKFSRKFYSKKPDEVFKVNIQFHPVGGLKK